MKTFIYTSSDVNTGVLNPEVLWEKKKKEKKERSERKKKTEKTVGQCEEEHKEEAGHQ